MHRKRHVLRFCLHAVFVFYGLATGYPADVAVPVKDLDQLVDTASAGDAPREAGEAVPAPGAYPAPGSSQPSAERAPAYAAGTSGEKGVILSAETGKPVPKAVVLLVRAGGDTGSSRYSAVADQDGLYSFSGLPPGAYRLKAGKRGFAYHEVEAAEFAAGGNPFREIRLERSVMKGQLIEAKAGGGAGGAATMMAARRASSGVMEGVGAEQIAKSTDSDAGAVAKRITGTSLVGGKYIYVRGLGERYTNMTLNGLPVPSPEKDKRVVPQDLFPASALDKFVLYKTFSPELYADFAGGSVALETKGIPEKRFLKVSAGMGSTDYSGDGEFLNLKQQRLAYDGGNSFWGYDDGTRAVPEGVPHTIVIRNDEEVQKYKDQGLPASTREERARYAVAFPNVYALDSLRMNPNQSYSLSLGGVHARGEGRAGYVFSAGFKNKHNQRNRIQRVMGQTGLTEKVTEYIPALDTVIERSKAMEDTVPLHERTDPTDSTVSITRIAPGIERNIQTGAYEAVITGLADFGWEANRDHRLFWKNFFVNIGSDEASATRSRQLPFVGLHQDKPLEDRYLLEFSRRSLLSSQVGGGHYVGAGPVDTVSWVAGFARTEGETPDSRKYKYNRENDSSGFDIFNNDVWGTRIYEEVWENALAGRVDASLAIPPAWSVRDTFLTEGTWISRLRLPEARAGAAGNFRRREFKATRYTYDSDRGIYTNTLLETIREPNALETKILMGSTDADFKRFDFRTSPRKYDEYRAAEGIFSGYFSLLWGFDLFRQPVEVEAGGRSEFNRLDFTAPYTGEDAGDDLRKIDSLTKRIHVEEWDHLPSLGLSVRPHKGGRIHLHYAATVIRPELREIAPYSYYDYASSRDIEGNPELRKIKVRHWDLRWDWFLPGQQILSVSLFNKDFTDPIEVVVDFNAGQGFQNSRSAYVRGVEFEGNLDLSVVMGAAGLSHPVFKGWVLYGNLAFMRSDVELDTAVSDTGEAVANTSTSRPLMGQSPYLYNLKLTHEIEARRWSLLNALLFNAAGERLRDVGVGGAPDIYEQPFPSLDYLGRLTLFKNLELSWTIKNLLNTRKRNTAYEYNRDKRYYTTSRERIEKAFQGHPDSYDTEIVPEGIGYELKLGYGI